MNAELKKRIFTSLLLLIGMSLMFFYTYVLIGSLILLGVICWIEFYSLICKILKKETLKNKLLRFFYKALSLIYLSLLIFFIFYVKSIKTELQVFIIYSLLVSIMSDIGGFTFGKFFKGMKLTKISPKKTYSGMIGGFFLSIIFINFFLEISYLDNSIEFSIEILIFVIFVSSVSQLGDILISYFKRRSKIKDTGKIIPGHGGLLDRIDGMIFAFPFSYFVISTNMIKIF